MGRVSGGRVLAVTGLGDDLAVARAAAYSRIAAIRFDGMQVRRDIGWRAPGATLTSYAAAGVDIDEGNRAVRQMKGAVERTLGPDVLRGVGQLRRRHLGEVDHGDGRPRAGGLDRRRGHQGRARGAAGMVRGVGVDIVNHCIDDVLVQSARPLFFLDYIAASKLDADLVAEVVTGMAEACEAAGCALLGGETAEMPGVYAPGAFDIAGTLIGVAERSRLLPRDDVAAGDVLIGVASSGPHTNGYSFLRKLFDWLPLDAVPAGLDRPLGEALLEPHRSYLDVLGPGDRQRDGEGARPHHRWWAPREPAACAARRHRRTSSSSDRGRCRRCSGSSRELATGVDTHELHRMLNMGIGMVVVCDAAAADEVQALIPEETWIIGDLIGGTAGARTVHLVTT